MAKENRQQVVCDYIYNNYVQFSRLRRDLISNKVQIRIEAELWRDITTSDINDIVCDCSTESGLSISAKEVLAVLQSHRTAETTNPDCTRLYVRKADVYNRSTPVKSSELEARAKFAAVAQMVQARKNNLTTLSTDQEAYADQKNEPNGKKTWKSYLWMVCKEAYEENSH